MNLLKILSAKNWGAKQRIIANTYKACIQPKIDYGSVAYSSASKTLLKKLDPILNTSMRIALGAYRTSPATSILSECNIYGSPVTT